MSASRTALVLIALGVPGSAFAGDDTRVDVCHWTPEDGAYNLITVPSNSAHLTRHGDDFRWPGADVVPVYRVFDGAGSQDHLYTTSTSELAFLTGMGWTAEGILGYAYDVSGDDLSPVYRLYNGVDHLYTMDTDEITFAQAHGYVSEGIAWYAFSADGGALSDVYRVYRGGTDHLYTMSAGERDGLLAGGGVDEGVLGYMFTTAVSCE